jgi:hypothetical protein
MSYPPTDQIATIAAMTDRLDENTDIDPALSELPLATLHGLYIADFRGFELCKLMKTAAQDADLKKTAPTVEKAVRAALTDFHVLVAALDRPSKPPRGWKGIPLKGEAADLRTRNFEGNQVLLELYWRMQELWKGLEIEHRRPALARCKVLNVDDLTATPIWGDFLEMLSELQALNHDAGDGDSFPSEWYEALLERYERQTSRKKSTRTSREPPPPPPPDDQILAYSPRTTYEIGDWLRHVKFGVGRVVEAGDHVSIEFSSGVKRLVHTPPSVQKLGTSAPPSTRPPSIDTAALARASGITIQRVPTKPLDDD